MGVIGTKFRARANRHLAEHEPDPGAFAQQPNRLFNLVSLGSVSLHDEHDLFGDRSEVRRVTTGKAGRGVDDDKPAGATASYLGQDLAYAIARHLLSNGPPGRHYPKAR